MIWSDELSASLDQPSGVVVFHRVQPSREQQLALSLAERVNQLVEQNEKTLDLKLGGGNWQERSSTTQTTKENTRDERSRTSARGMDLNDCLNRMLIHYSQVSPKVLKDHGLPKVWVIEWETLVTLWPHNAFIH